MLKDKFKMYTQNGQEDIEEDEIPVPEDRVQRVVKTLLNLSSRYTEILTSTVLYDQVENTVEIRLKLKR